MIIEVPDAAVPEVWKILQIHFGRLRRNGYEPPPELAAFASALVKTADRRDAGRDALIRARALSAARSRRYRARRRAVTKSDVALRRPLSPR
jgi:hypothetical protein